MRTGLARFYPCSEKARNRLDAAAIERSEGLPAEHATISPCSHPVCFDGPFRKPWQPGADKYVPVAIATSFISINNVASAQFEFRVEDWVDRSQRARELALSINGYEVSPRPRGFACHRLKWVWVEADAAGREVSWGEFRLLVPTNALIPITLHVANAVR